MYSLKDKYAIVGIGYTDFTKRSGRTVRSLASEACLKAVADAGLTVNDVDGLVSFHFTDSAPAIGVASTTAGSKRMRPHTSSGTVRRSISCQCPRT